MDFLSFALTAIAGLAGTLAYLIYSRLNYWRRRGIPHDKPHFWQGNLHGIKTEFHIQELLRNYYEKYKHEAPFVGFYLFQQPVAFITDIRLVKNILIKDFNCFGDRPSYYNERDDPLTANLFTLEHDKWKPLRQKFTPTFTSGKMKYMFPTVLQVGREFQQVLQSLVSGETAVLEVRELFARFTTDVIGSCAFGIQCNSLKNPKAEFRVMGQRLMSERKSNNMLRSLAMAYPKIGHLLGVITFPKDCTQFFGEAVQKTLQHREQHNIKCNDFMDLLLDLKQQDVGCGKLTAQQCAAQAFIFYLAGFETSSTTAAFALYELALHEQLQQQARCEIVECLQRHNNELSYECLREMKYLDQIIAETLRLYTVVPMLVRRANKNYAIPQHGKHTIEKNTLCIIPATAIHRDEQFYAEPNKFNPEHFSAEQVQQRDAICYLPFGEGPRHCIGLRFGQMQTKIALVLLLHKFRVSASAETQIPMRFNKKDAFCSAESGIFLQFEKIV